MIKVMMKVMVMAIGFRMMVMMVRIMMVMTMMMMMMMMMMMQVVSASTRGRTGRTSLGAASPHTAGGGGLWRGQGSCAPQGHQVSESASRGAAFSLSAAGGASPARTSISQQDFFLMVCFSSQLFLPHLLYNIIATSLI
ncbi:hypothetical protein FHG87_016507 [Trinorchestia longiramus]|nr:hypothetical protein FHG87_016507 [Trinorchestia longiramus]